MTANIEHEDILDVRDLAALAIEQGELIADTETDEDDREDAVDTLKALSALLSDLGHQVPADAPGAGENIAEAFNTIMVNSTPTLIADHYFVEAIEQDVKDIYGMPSDLPGFIAIDWEQTAENLKPNYSEVTLDENKYWISRG